MTLRSRCLSSRPSKSTAAGSCGWPAPLRCRCITITRIAAKTWPSCPITWRHRPGQVWRESRKRLEAAGATFGDVVHIFVFRARPRMGDIGRASAIINSYFAPYDHKPTSTNLAVLELGDPEQLIEIQMVAVVD